MAEGRGSGRSVAATARVLQVVLSLGPGGTERLVVELISRLRSEIPMAVCCLDGAGIWGEELRGSGVTVDALHRHTGFHPLLGRTIAHAAARHGANVLHCHHYSPFVYGGLARLWRPGLRMVFTEHGRLSDAPPSRKRKTANRILALAPQQVFAVSADLKAHIVAEGFPQSKVGVIYNGIDVGPLPNLKARQRVREALGLTDGTIVIGTVARLDPVKDLGVLIQAVSTLKGSRQAKLLVVGDGDRRKQLEAFAIDAGASEAVRFLGHREDVRDLLAGCDIYANSSISEGVSLTILEAMAAALPVVATRVGGTPEVVDDTCARLVPARDPAAMAAALEELAGNPDLRAALGRAGRERVEARFTLDRMVGQYRDTYLLAAGA